MTETMKFEILTAKQKRPELRTLNKFCNMGSVKIPAFNQFIDLNTDLTR